MEKKSLILAKRDRTKQRLDRRIGRSFVRVVKNEIKNILYQCVSDEPAQVKHVTFRRGVMCIELAWPFLLPHPTGNPDDWLGSKRAVRLFCERFKIHLLEQRRGAQLSNLFNRQFWDFLYGYFRAPNFEQLRVSKSSEDTVRDHLKALENAAASRRGAGPRKISIPDTRAKDMKREGCAIIKVLRDIRTEHSRPKAEITQDTEDALLTLLASKYDFDRYPWMKYFRRSFGLLTPTKAWGQKRPRLAAPASWGTKALALQILREKYLREKGTDYSLASISGIVKC